jgi:2-amino-4-hydroxy-6-hydroxymethyldihydropteridine diphosphokinase
MYMAVCAYLALGSNMGEREKHLREAVELLHAKPGIVVTAVSDVYETEPVGFVDQPAFLNMVAAIETDLSPVDLLSEMLRTEGEMGRVRIVRWGPRIIDIDILLYGNERIDLTNLQIPHPEMAKRAFVLVPLRDVWKGDLLPFWGKTVDELIQATDDFKGVRRWGTLDWVTGYGPSAS